MLQYIREYWAEHGHSPSVREIAAEFGDRSTSAVRYGLGRLEQRGKISRKPGAHRSIVLVDRDGDEPAN